MLTNSTELSSLGGLDGLGAALHLVARLPAGLLRRASHGRARTRRAAATEAAEPTGLRRRTGRERADARARLCLADPWVRHARPLPDRPPTRLGLRSRRPDRRLPGARPSRRPG